MIIDNNHICREGNFSKLPYRSVQLFHWQKVVDINIGVEKCKSMRSAHLQSKFTHWQIWKGGIHLWCNQNSKTWHMITTKTIIIKTLKQNVGTLKGSKVPFQKLHFLLGSFSVKNLKGGTQNLLQVSCLEESHISSHLILSSKQTYKVSIALRTKGKTVFQICILKQVSKNILKFD